MKKIIISLIFALGLATTSYATILEGFSVGASVASGGFYAVGTEKGVKDQDTQEAGAFQADFASVFIEYNTGSISIGLDYIATEIETPTNTNFQIDVADNGTGSDGGTNNVKASFENHTTLYAIIPLPLGGLYFKAGAIYVDINTLENLQTGGAYPNVDTTGVTAGLGYSVEAANGISVRAEVLAAQYEDVNATNSTDGTKSVAIEDMMSASGRISLVKTF